MKYSNPKSSGKNILHQFSKGQCTIGGNDWDKIDFTFSELRNNSNNRSFIFTIRYNNYDKMDFRLNQFTIHSEDDIRQIYNIIGSVINNTPKFNS